MIADWPRAHAKQLGSFLLWVRDTCKPQTAAGLISDAEREACVSVNHDDERAALAIRALEAMEDDWEGFVLGCYRLIPAQRKLRIVRDLKFVRDGIAGNYWRIGAGTIVDQITSRSLVGIEQGAFLRAQKRNLPRLLVPFQHLGRVHWAYLDEDLVPATNTIKGQK